MTSCSHCLDITKTGAIIAENYFLNLKIFCNRAHFNSLFYKKYKNKLKTCVFWFFRGKVFFIFVVYMVVFPIFPKKQTPYSLWGLYSWYIFLPNFQKNRVVYTINFIKPPKIVHFRFLLLIGPPVYKIFWSFEKHSIKFEKSIFYHFLGFLKIF